MLELFRKLFALPPGASSFSRGVDLLHFFVIGSTLLGSLSIGLTATLLILRYRARSPDATTPRLSVSRRRETLVVSGTLLLFCGFWLVGFKQYLDMQRAPRDARRVYVTAKQWMWKFTSAEGRSYNDVLTLEVGVPVELFMTSRDVIHSFFVPAFRAKRDVLPGRYVSVWFEPVKVGEYPIFCAEYCGINHSNMRGVVRVLSSAEYQRWLRGSPSTSGDSLAELGREAAARHSCFACHTVDGQPHVGPTWSRLYGSTVTLADGRRVIADAEYLTRSMMEPAAELVAGFPALMPTYLGTLSQPDTAAILEYIRSLADGPVRPSVPLPRLTVSAASAEPNVGEAPRTNAGAEESRP